jgi:predicted membrane protein
MAQRTTAVMGIGELELDISLASMLPHSVLDVYALIGEVTVYVPSSVRVSVRALTLIGEAKAVDEARDGILVHMDEEFPAQGANAASAPHLEIRAFLVIGELTIKQIDAPIVTIVKVVGQTPPPALPQAQ